MLISGARSPSARSEACLSVPGRPIKHDQTTFAIRSCSAEANMHSTVERTLGCESCGEQIALEVKLEAVWAREREGERGIGRY